MNLFCLMQQREGPGLKPNWVGGEFRGLKPPANPEERARFAPEERARFAREAGSSASLRNDSQKGKGKGVDAKGATLATFRQVKQRTAEEEADSPRE